MEEIQVIVIDNQEVVTLYVDSGVVTGVDSVNGKTGVVLLQTDDIPEVTNLYYTEARVSANAAVALNTAKVGITPTQASDITTNNAKVGVTNEEENTINSEVEAGMSGEDLVLNVLSLTQAEYDAGTPISTTFYIITDA